MCNSASLRPQPNSNEPADGSLKRLGMTERKDEVNQPAEPGTVKLYGVTWPWFVTQEALDALKDYDVWDDDVWIVTYPKAGTHWAMEIVNLILVDGHEERINRAQQSHPVEFDLSQPGRSVFKEPRPPQYKAMAQWTAPRVIMTHLTEELMPSQIYQGKGKVVYVIRNPKDTTVSNWNFVKPMKFDSRYEKWDYFVKLSFSEEMVFGSWFPHVLDFWTKHRYDKNFLFLKYEDMIKDKKRAVIQITDFLGKHLSDDAVDRVVELCSFQSMKARFNLSQPSAKEAPPSVPPSDQESAPPDDQAKPPADKGGLGAPSILRKGTVGDWKTMFTVAQNEELNALFREKMEGSGLTIEFE
ncbi:sulfotransferase 1A1-like [Acanthaster planci]|uniref:Sulfotransferase 1A1-like n=1 Tax=Acanthaster planci TaxID=133434 RepID=A0A8B7YNA5_ACAPL|nr:sulfotransferase 1A1-like [Acanthaster planci]